MLLSLGLFVFVPYMILQATLRRAACCVRSMLFVVIQVERSPLFLGLLLFLFLLVLLPVISLRMLFLSFCMKLFLELALFVRVLHHRLEPIVFRRVSISAVFMQNWSVSKVLEAASWKLNSVFASLYLRDVQYVFEGLHSLGPIVAQVLSFNRSFGFLALASVSILGELFPLYSFVFSSSFYLYNLLGLRSQGSFIAVGAVVNPYLYLGVWIPASFSVLSRMLTSGIFRLCIHFYSG